MTLTVSIDNDIKAHIRLSSGSYIVGRDSGSCVRLDDLWISRVQARIQVLEQGWVVTNGFRTRMHATSATVEAEAGEGGAIWVPNGDNMTLVWPELPHRLVLEVNRQMDRVPDLPLPAILRVQGLLLRQSTVMSNLLVRGEPRQDQPLRARARSRNAPIVAGTHDLPEPRPFELRQRSRLAVLFRHEILGTPRPQHLYLDAAQELGVSVPALKQLVHRTLERLNTLRTVKLKGVDALGYYLVHTSGELSEDDLPER